jgi:sugar O-acyltransferase (sialic acid O-acetyltransferase NeuD family)
VNTSEKIFIIGNGGHARSIADVILHNAPSTKLVFIDQNSQQNETLFDFPCYKKTIGSFNNKCIVAIGDNGKRKIFFEMLQAKQQYSVISSLAYISKYAQIKNGCFVGNFSHIGPEAVIGENSIINTAAIIEHETKIGSHSHVAPNVIVAGRVTIGDLVFVGCGATIINNVTICSQVVIGAGATVINNIAEPGTYVGCPAKKVQR